MEPEREEYFDALTVLLGSLSALLFFGVLVGISIVSCSMVIVAMAIVLFVRCYLYAPRIVAGSRSYDQLQQMLYQNGLLI
jgi:uncharacterized membrane protein YdjX (TVP38/TMEM64 family)